MAEHFDQYQFAGRRVRAITKDSGIAWSDYKTMHMEGNRVRNRHTQRIPPFALDQKKLAEVLKNIAWRYAHQGPSTPCPEGISLEELKSLTDAQDKKHAARRERKYLTDYQRHLIEEHGRVVEKAGGYLQMYANVAWMAWRRNMNSAEIAAETGISPCTVRQYLNRMNKTARSLFPEHATPLKPLSQKMVQARRAKPGDPNPLVLPMPEIIEWFKAGMNLKAIAEKYGCGQEMLRVRIVAWQKQNGIRIQRAPNGTAKKAAINLLKLGLSPAQVASRVDSTPGTVIAWRRLWEKETGIALPRFKTGKQLAPTRKIARRAARILKLSKGQCGIEGCQNTVQPNEKECPKHKEYYNQKAREYQARKKTRAELIAEGLCAQCNTLISQPGKTECDYHLAYNVRWQQARRDRLKEARNKAAQTLEEANAIHESTSPETLRPAAGAGEPQEEQGRSAELQMA